MSNESSPVVPYWHVWTDPDGISRQTLCELAEFQRTATQWIGNATVFVTVLPAPRDASAALLRM